MLQELQIETPNNGECEVRKISFSNYSSWVVMWILLKCSSGFYSMLGFSICIPANQYDLHGMTAIKKNLFEIDSDCLIVILD
jgi:hypothetical protein